MSGDPFDGGLIDVTEYDGRDAWAYQPYNVELSDNVPAEVLGVIAALANLGRLMPWTGTVAPKLRFQAHYQHPVGWGVWDTRGYGFDVMDATITEAQAHAIAAILNDGET